MYVCACVIGGSASKREKARGREMQSDLGTRLSETKAHVRKYACMLVCNVCVCVCCVCVYVCYVCVCCVCGFVQKEERERRGRTVASSCSK